MTTEVGAFFTAVAIPFMEQYGLDVILPALLFFSIIWVVVRVAIGADQ